MRSHGRLRCEACGAGLVPAWAGLRCPRLAACGKGGGLEARQPVRLVAPPRRGLTN